MFDSNTNSKINPKWCDIIAQPKFQYKLGWVSLNITVTGPLQGHLSKYQTSIIWLLWSYIVDESYTNKRRPHIFQFRRRPHIFKLEDNLTFSVEIQTYIFKLEDIFTFLAASAAQEVHLSSHTKYRGCLQVNHWYLSLSLLALLPCDWSTWFI